MKDIENRIQKLIESSDFIELTSAEQEMVISVYSEDEYNQMRDGVRGYVFQFEKEREFLTPSLESFAVLKQELDEKNRKKKSNVWAVFLGVFSYRMPAYQPFMAICLMFGLLYFLNRPVENIVYVDREVVVVNDIVDTIYIEEVREVEIVKFVTTPTRELEVTSAVELTTTYENSPTSLLVQEAEVPAVSEITSSFGNTVFEKEDMADFKVRM